jgi:hypothetical protein
VFSRLASAETMQPYDRPLQRVAMTTDNRNFSGP